MNNLSRLIQKIKENPVAYLDKPSTTNLDSFLTGYLDTRTRLGLEQEGSGFEHFEKWVEETKQTNVPQLWAKITRFRCGGERIAFDEFFRLFERFLNQHESSNDKSESGEESSSILNDPSFKNYDYYDDLLYHVRLIAHNTGIWFLLMANS